MIRTVLLVSAPAALGVIAVAGAMASATASASLNQSAAVQACAEGRSPNSRITNMAYLQRFVPCVVGQFRSQIGTTVTEDPGLSSALRGALKSFAASHSHKPLAVVNARDRKIANARCNTLWTFSARFQDSTAPPALTPKSAGRNIKELFDHPAASQPTAAFGFAYIKNVLFHSGPKKGSSLAYGVYALHCPPF